MAFLTRKYTLFETTSPRTPMLMIPDITLLVEKYSGKKWNRATQIDFTNALYELDDNKGKNLKSGNKDLVARDRITRSPKKFGFVRLSPVIELTAAGKVLLSAKRKEEILLRQLLKYQLPSPYHIQGKSGVHFWVKPYLELFRLIRHFGSLSFDEMMLFGLQMTDYHKFDAVVESISSFRKEKTAFKGNYKKFLFEKTRGVVLQLFENEIREGRTQTRETKDSSLAKFISTKKNNMRDYTDAIFRYLRGTGIVNISQSGHSISIIPDRLEEVDFFLTSMDRDPCFEKKADIEEYLAYLTDPELPRLLTDNKTELVRAIHYESSLLEVDESMSLYELKQLLAEIREEHKNDRIQENIVSLKSQRQYDDIVEKFRGIKEKKYYDNALMFEWNAWRAMTMLDGGTIKANLNFDDFGNPLSTAAGNMADIVCDYGDFALTVELTLSSGQRQFDTESEPVPRHLGRYKQVVGKQTYCLFISPRISEATIAFFFGLHKNPIDFYGGETIIVPIELDYFEKMLADAYQVGYTPSPSHIRLFFETLSKSADQHTGQDGWRLWYEDIKQQANNWLVENANIPG